MDSHLRQKFLNPFTLRAAQVLLDCTRTYPVTTETQGQEIAPFFIIGSGRSGTTLLRSVLQRHPEIHIPPESHGAIPNSVKKFYRYGGLDWQDLVSVVLGEFSSYERFNLWEMDLLEAQQRALDLPDEEKTLAKIIDLIYREHMETHKPGATMWGDKSPFNTLRLEWVHRIFPAAKYIHIIRDGRDVVSSYLASELIEEIDEACRRWNLSLEHVEKHEKKTGNKALEIYYEQFVKNPEKSIRRLCKHLGIRFSEDMLSNESVYLGDDHLNHLKNVNKPITEDSVGKWEERLSAGQKKTATEKMAQKLKKHRYI